MRDHDHRRLRRAGRELIDTDRRVRDWASLTGSGAFCYLHQPARVGDQPTDASVRRLESCEPSCERVAERAGRCDLQVISLEVDGCRLGREFRDDDVRGAVDHQHLPVDAEGNEDPAAGADYPP